MASGRHVTLHKIAEYPDGVDSLVGMSNFIVNETRGQLHTNWSVIGPFCRIANRKPVRPGQRLIDQGKTTIGSSHVFERQP
jgi:hypothetical protein